MAPRRPPDPPPALGHPWERQRRAEFARWEHDLGRTPYDRPLPDVVGFAETIEPPLEWADRVDRRRVFGLSALPVGPGPTYLAVVPPRHRRPPEGSLVRLLHPTKRAMPVGDLGSAELVLEATAGVTTASWEEILPGLPVQTVPRIVPELADLLRLPAPAVETLLLPIVASLPWHGRTAGVDLHVEVDGWPLRRYRPLFQSLAALAPEWVTRSRTRGSSATSIRELASGARLRARARTTRVPYSIRFRPISGPAVTLPPGDRAGSVVTYGAALADEFAYRAARGSPVLLLEAEAARRVPERPVEIPDDIRIAVWGLHWWVPTPPDTPEWHRWFRAAYADVGALWDRLRAAGRPASGDPALGASPEVRDIRDRLTQVAWARARLRAANEMDEADVRWAVDRLLEAGNRALEWQARGHGPLRRLADRTEAGRTARLRRVLTTLLRERPSGLTIGEAVDGLRSARVGASDWDVETQLERLRIQGALYQDQAGRYRPV